MKFQTVIEIEADAEHAAAAWLDGKTRSRRWLLWGDWALFPISRWAVR